MATGVLIDGPQQAGDATLIKTARCLDKGTQPTPEKLSSIWAALSSTSGSPFHASEEVVIRWLLKNMNAKSSEGECFRRYPLVWSILGCVFTRIPLFSLAKSLSERQFIPVLRQSLTEFAKPQNDSGSDVEMVDASANRENSMSRKRKRTTFPTFDLNNLRETQRCLESAGAAFEALRTLIARIDNSTKSSIHEKMGGEHIKSLFSASAKDTAELIRPMVSLCDLALSEQNSNWSESQRSWTAIIKIVWDFHVQGQQDAYEIVTLLSQSLCSILAKLSGYWKQQSLDIDPEVKAAWTKDLRRFFTKAILIPARAAFLQRKDLSVLEMAVEMTKNHASTASPVLFDLVLKAPHVVGEAGAKKDNEAWVQKVFDVLEEPLRQARASDGYHVVGLMLEMARDKSTGLSLDSLRAVCKNYALSDDVDWELIYRIADADTDVFLVSQDGLDLLASVLDRTISPEGTESDLSIKFIVVLAKGFAKSRDLSGFIQKWFEYLNKALVDSKSVGTRSVWLSHEVRDAVSGLIQPSMTTKQLGALLDWLESHDSPSQKKALLVILDTISNGISEEDYVDAVDATLFDITFQRIFDSTPDFVASLRWSITRRTISWVTLQQSCRIWAVIRPELTRLLEKGPVAGEVTLEAFKCACAAWLSSYPGGDYESEAGSLVSAFLDKLTSTKEEKSFSTGWGIINQASLEYPRLVDLVTKRSGQFPSFIQHHIARLAKDRRVVDATFHGLLSSEHSLNNRPFIGNLIQEVAQSLSKQKLQQLDDMHASDLTLFYALLDIPHECFSRDQREAIMLSLIDITRSQKAPMRKHEGNSSGRKIFLSLMTKLMQRPTFYENMKFTDLVEIGEVMVASSHGTADQEPSERYEALRLFVEFVKLTLRQMTSNMDGRECKYLSEAADIISGWGTETKSDSNTIHLLLLNALASALEDSAAFKSAKQPPIDVALVNESLSSEAVMFVKSIRDTDGSSPIVLISLEQLDAVPSPVIQERLHLKLGDLESTAMNLCTKGLKAGWKLRSFLTRHFKQHLRQSFSAQLEEAASLQMQSPSETNGHLAFNADSDDILQYINIVVDGLNDTEQLHYIRDLLTGLSEDSTTFGRLLAVHRLVDIHGASDTLNSSRLEAFDLATAHSILSRHLVQAAPKADFVLTAQILHMLLDKRASAMTQWNIEVTLSSVCTLLAEGTLDIAKYSRKRFGLLCRLVEVIIKRHRLRLEGHFHLLVAVLQSLLTDLLCHKPQGSPTNPRREDAKSYARLLTLVCEPTVASVTRSQPSSLDSATDAAKRLAGQHMYLVLMLYIKLQLEQSVPHDVREALEPGIYSILDISPTETRRIMNDAMDGSGRAIFKELYKQYLKFGKWTGI